MLRSVSRRFLQIIFAELGYTNLQQIKSAKKSDKLVKVVLSCVCYVVLTGKKVENIFVRISKDSKFRMSQDQVNLNSFFTFFHNTYS